MVLLLFKNLFLFLFKFFDFLFIYNNYNTIKIFNSTSFLYCDNSTTGVAFSIIILRINIILIPSMDSRLRRRRPPTY